jgi:predicted dinucleotide-binding enzyme
MTPAGRRAIMAAEGRKEGPAGTEGERAMRIGMLGAGQVAQAIAGHAVAAGHQVVLSNRHGPAALAPVIARLGPLASAGTPAEAARAGLVVLAVWWNDIPAAIAAADVSDWAGRIVIDATNQFESGPPHVKVADLGDTTGSEHVAAMLPGARVVKAFNSLNGAYIAAQPRHQAGRCRGCTPSSRTSLSSVPPGLHNVANPARKRDPLKQS